LSCNYLGNNFDTFKKISIFGHAMINLYLLDKKKVDLAISEKRYLRILQKIKKERQKAGLSQYDFAKKLDISQNTYFRIETNKAKLTFFRFLLIAKKLEIEPKMLVDV